MGEARAARLSMGWRLIAVVVGIVATASLMVALNWTELTTTPAQILNAEGRPNSPELTLYFGSCLIDYTISVDETEDEVQVLILLDAARIGECPDIGNVATVLLDEPLRARTLRDKSTDTAVPINEPLPR